MPVERKSQSGGGPATPLPPIFISNMQSIYESPVLIKALILARATRLHTRPSPRLTLRVVQGTAHDDHKCADDAGWEPSLAIPNHKIKERKQGMQDAADTKLG